MLDIIKKRYVHQKSIYTWCGIALVAVNPYQEQDIYGDQVVQAYHSASHSVYLQLDPHIYAITEDAFSKLERNVKDQSIIVSGESGAGKTVSAKHAMRYLASIASSKAKVRVEQRVLASNPIMEAIGNASTVRNDNSSRFGKYIQIYFDRHSRKILGANMRTYLLEKSRVTKLQPGERNFHIFYQLLNYAHKNPSKMSHLHLLNPDDENKKRQFRFLNGVEPSDKRDDLRPFIEALSTLNIDRARIDVIYKIIGGILHGGNINFVTKDGEDPDDQDAKCTIDLNCFHFNSCCQLLGLDPEETRERITTKLLRTGSREVIVQRLTKKKAEYARDAMLKYVYECLFVWLVGLINLSLKSKEAQLAEGSAAAAASNQQNNLKSPTAKKSILDAIAHEPQFIGVLDIYGFENFKTNSFEQFCINYANEVLQQQYNQHVFKIEQEEYVREGIDWTFIEYSDNQPVIDTIESRPIGILNLLDEECRMPKGTDMSWCAKLYDHLMVSPVHNKSASKQDVHAKSQIFKRPKIGYQKSFTISHYAEEVSYDVDTFLEKNRDTIAEEQGELLRKSEIINHVFEDPLLSPDMRPRPRTMRSATVGNQFRASLAALIKTLNSTEPHYVRCIKPNDEKKAFEFNDDRAVQQLKACGVYETIRISNMGFPSRWLYRDFARRYSVLIYGTQALQKVIEARNTLIESESGETDDNSDSNNNKVSPPNQNFNRSIGQLSSVELRPVCDAICSIAYQPNSVYQHLRTKQEQEYIDKLIERHGNQANAIYQFGRNKIFFRDGQVGYLERVRSQRLRDYTVTIQRHVRGWLARRSFAKRREQFLQQLQREASMVSLQNQVNSLQIEVEQVKVDQEEVSKQNVSRLESMYHLVVDLAYASIQPLVIDAILQFEALEAPEPFTSLESNRSIQSEVQPMHELVKELDKLYDLIIRNQVPQDVATQAYRQLFYLICAQSLNQLLIRSDLCQFGKSMQIRYNLSTLAQWCRDRDLASWREIVAELEPIIQATVLLQTRKSRSEDVPAIEEICNKLRPSQIIKLLNMYSSTYEEEINMEFIDELEEYLNKKRPPAATNEDLFMASTHSPLIECKDTPTPQSMDCQESALTISIGETADISVTE